MDKRLEIYSAFNTAVTTCRSAVAEDGSSAHHQLSELALRGSQMVLIAPPETTYQADVLFYHLSKAVGSNHQLAFAEPPTDEASGIPSSGHMNLDNMVSDLVVLQRRDIQGVPRAGVIHSLHLLYRRCRRSLYFMRRRNRKRMNSTATRWNIGDT